MVRGLPEFRKYFKAYTDQYVLIGGTASDVLFDTAGLNFRATKDFDIVLIVEALSDAFIKVFWKFIEEGGYTNRHQSTGRPQFYRFHSPTNVAFPRMLELFCRIPDGLIFNAPAHLTPLPLDEESSSLSAIILNDDYYQLVKEHCIQIQDISIITAEGLIPLKAKAWLDQTRRKNSGEKIQTTDIIKHRNDVFRLYQLLVEGEHTTLPRVVQNDLKSFLSQIKLEVTAHHPQELGIVGRTTAEIMVIIENYYQLEGSE